eukprot:6392282-Prymnesium_polylepis.1
MLVSIRFTCLNRFRWSRHASTRREGIWAFEMGFEGFATGITACLFRLFWPFRPFQPFQARC